MAGVFLTGVFLAGVPSLLAGDTLGAATFFGVFLGVLLGVLAGDFDGVAEPFLLDALEGVWERPTKHDESYHATPQQSQQCE